MANKFVQQRMQVGNSYDGAIYLASHPFALCLLHPLCADAGLAVFPPVIYATGRCSSPPSSSSAAHCVSYFFSQQYAYIRVCPHTFASTILCMHATGYQQLLAYNSRSSHSYGGLTDTKSGIAARVQHEREKVKGSGQHGLAINALA